MSEENKKLQAQKAEAEEDSAEKLGDTDDLQEEETSEDRKKKVLSEIYDWLEVFAVSISLVILIFSFVMRLAVVDGDSMNMTLIDREVLVVSKLGGRPENGDIVVFQSGYNGYSNPIVKRVIATGGQTVDIDFENWIVYVDGVALKEDYVNRVDNKAMRNYYGSEAFEYPLTVEEGKLFVLGDNRNDSTDSRSRRIGLVDEELIMGKVVLRIFPFSRVGGF
ncbi:MAG: signal peptidase I [Ruminococcaceae bacterium]|nr:signal peptidase I [Oscillospiraceae bacterium]